MSGLPKRFYKKAEVAEINGGWTVRLDGKAVRTPGKATFVLPSAGLAREIAAEWEAQGERIDPDTMPLTRIANTAIDRVRGQEHAVADEIASFAASDLVCYRADAPEGLVEMQVKSWDPVLAWADRELGARLVAASGITHQPQPDASFAAIRREIGAHDAFALAALHTLTTLTGSALLALALIGGALSAAEVWAAAHVDEDWQISRWGEDDEAMARRGKRREEFDAAARVLSHTTKCSGN